MVLLNVSSDRCGRPKAQGYTAYNHRSMNGELNAKRGIYRNSITKTVETLSIITLKERHKNSDQRAQPQRKVIICQLDSMPLPA